MNGTSKSFSLQYQTFFRSKHPTVMCRVKCMVVEVSAFRSSLLLDSTTTPLTLFCTEISSINTPALVHLKNSFYCLGGYEGNYRSSYIGRFSNGSWTKLSGRLNLVRVGVRAIVINNSIKGRVKSHTGVVP